MRELHLIGALNQITIYERIHSWNAIRKLFNCTYFKLCRRKAEKIKLILNLFKNHAFPYGPSLQYFSVESLLLLEIILLTLKQIFFTENEIKMWSIVSVHFSLRVKIRSAAIWWKIGC